MLSHAIHVNISSRFRWNSFERIHKVFTKKNVGDRKALSPSVFTIKGHSIKKESQIAYFTLI
jgi:hypothetical protein